MTTQRRNQTTITRLQPGQIDWEDDSGPATNLAARQRNTFVPARQEQYTPPQLARGDLQVGLDIIPTATTHTEVTGDHLNRSQAWLRYALPLCLSFALVIVVLAMLFTPIMDAELGWAFLRAVGLYLGMFVASYVFMFRYYMSRSPEGLALKQSDETWAFLRREQAHRHTIEREAWNRYIEGSSRK